MSKNLRIVLTILIVVGAVIVGAMITRDIFLGYGKTIECDDGSRQTIDIRRFDTDYWAYSYALEATLREKGKLSAKIAPTEVQQMSEALQQANEFRKYLVAGYNSCAVSKAQYSDFGTRFQGLDNLSRQINYLSQKPTLSAKEMQDLSRLIRDYSQSALALGRTPRQ